MVSPVFSTGRAGRAGSACGRADLLECLHVYGEDALALMAPVLGFESGPEHKPLSAEEEKAQAAVDAAAEDGTTAGDTDNASNSGDKWQPPSGKGRLHFARLLNSETHDGTAMDERPEWAINPGELGPDDAGPASEQQPPPVPLSPWTRLWPFLYRVLGRQRTAAEPDITRLVSAIASGKTLRGMPLRRRHGWAPQAQVLLDRSAHLTPYREDFNQLCRGLRRLRGSAGLQLLVFERGPEGGCRPWGEPHSRPRRYQPPAAGTPLLLLSDLGCLQRRSGAVDAWLSFGRQLTAAGLAAVVLQPQPRRYWRAELGRCYRPLFWERGRPLPRRLPPLPAGGGPPAAQDPAVERLLTLLAPALSLQPGLLRAARHLLVTPAAQSAEKQAGNASADALLADVGSESLAWQHPRMQASETAISYPPAAARDYRQAFRDLDADLQQRALALIRQHHGRQPILVRCEEELVAAQLCGHAAEQAQALMRRVFGSVDSARPGAGLAGLAAWLQRLGQRAQAGLLASSPALEAAWVRANAAALEGDHPPAMPAGFEPARVRWLLGSQAKPRQRLALYQLGNALVAVAADAPAPRSAAVLELLFQRPWLQIAVDGQAGKWRRLTAGTRLPLPQREAELRLTTDCQTVTLQLMQRPDWARRMGRDGSGLFALDAHGQRQELGLPEEQQQQVVPDWADEAGEDEYGRWAEVRIQDVPLRLRWIAAGEFWMGSPQDELERDNYETRHKVCLSQGYWLAETTVTQQLWQAVMGANPSSFSGPQRPVEQVSWDDCQRFITHINRACPALALRLPSEAEWEYACRAGSSGPFSFGANIDPDHVNYDGNHPYADGDKGEYRQQTVEVKALPCNDWGLYQMHGNVLEWCEDWFGAYPAGPLKDPAGPEAGARRVLRGGSWVVNAGWARSAYRGRWQPVYAGNVTGLRLARGQGQ